MSRICLRNVGKQFGDVEVIKDLSIDIEHGEFMVIIGPSGCGKSTLLRLIAGLEELSEGEILIDDTRVNDVAAKDRGVAMVFQSYALYPHMTVAENMGFSLKMSGNGKDEIHQAVATTARSLQLTELLERYPRQLSGGQRQRVAIGRAIVRRPGVFLFDEPLSNLDAALRAQTRLEIAELHKDIGGTSVYVTHDQIEAMTLADRILVLDKGRVEQIGTPMEIYRAPANLFVAGFIGTPRINVLSAEVRLQDASDVTELLIGASTLSINNRHLPNGSQVFLGLRPEAISIAADGQQEDLHGTVRHIERLGESSLVHVRLDEDTTVVVRDYADQEHRQGSEIGLRVDRARVLLFDTAGNAVQAVGGA